MNQLNFNNMTKLKSILKESKRIARINKTLIPTQSGLGLLLYPHLKPQQRANQVYRMFGGKSKIKLDDAPIIAEYLGCEVSDLI